LVIAYMALIYKIFGLNVLWVRLFNTLVSAISSALLYRTIRMACGPSVASFAAYIVVLYPSWLVWSSALLKESLYTLAVSLVASGLVCFGHGLLTLGVFVQCFVGISISLLLRPGLTLILFGLVGWVKLRPPTRFYRDAKKEILLSFLWFLLIAGVGIGFQVRRGTEISELSQLRQKAMSVGEILDTTSPLAKYVMTREPVIRVVIAPVLLLTTPPPTATLGIIPLLPGSTYVSWFIGCFAVSWWLLLPFGLAGFRACLERDRTTIWISTGIVLLLWFTICNYVRGISTNEIARAREHLSPLWILFACHGRSWLQGNPFVEKQFFNYLKCYWILIVGLALFWRYLR
jgi:hypothetical protein